MNGYIYNSDTRRIATKIENVTKCNDTEIKGDGWAKVGTGQYVITEDDYAEGGILPEGIEDRRSEIPTLISVD